MIRALAVVVVVGAFAGCGSDSNPKPASTSSAGAKAVIDIADFKYKPVSVSVKKGGSITWTNTDAAPHTATAEDGAPAEFDTDRLRKGDSKTIKLTTPGTYSYYCVYHPFMKGKLVVTD